MLFFSIEKGSADPPGGLLPPGFTLELGMHPDIDNRHLFESLNATPGDLIQVVCNGIVIRGALEDVWHSGATIVISTTDVPAMRWAVNAKQLVAAGRVVKDA